MSQWKMYRHKKGGVNLYFDQVEAEHVGAEPVPQEVRFAVECTDEGYPLVHLREDILPHSGEDRLCQYVKIRCPRNVYTPRSVTSAPKAEDLDERQWAKSTLPFERFNELYERL